MTNNTTTAHRISTAIDIDIYDDASLDAYLDDYLNIADPASIPADLDDKRATLIDAIDADLTDFLDNDYLEGMIDESQCIALSDDDDYRRTICTIIADQILANL